MARIAGVNIPPQKRVLIGLTYIHGIGPKVSKDICSKVKIEDERRVAFGVEFLKRLSKLVVGHEGLASSSRGVASYGRSQCDG